ncbi:TPA: hypothetical protein U2I45_001257 [Providencia rettgeri]|nr:hypothetical protein [Providencia rettgeri]
MKLTMPLLDYKDGFDFENDIFLRKNLSVQLENIIRKSEDESLVIALDDDWGNGKTTFLKMWEGEIIKNNEFQVVYFDAFQNDFQSDPFIALSSNIYKLVKDISLQKRYLEATKKVGSILLKASAKIGISALTLGLLKSTEIEELKDNVSDSLSSPIEQFIEDKIKSIEQEQETIEHFKLILSEIAADKKLIFIIDELDRARPNYSLELLERIKHIFNTRNIYFILATNKQQHLSIIQKTYGNIDANTYLCKFIHFWFKLPKTVNYMNNEHVIDKYANHVNNKLAGNAQHYKTSIDNLKVLLKINNCSLRDLERCFSLLMLVNASTPSGFTWEYQVGISILVYLKIKDEITYNKIINNDIKTRNDLLTALNIQDIPTNRETYHIYLAANTEFMDDQTYNDLTKGNRNFVFDSLYGDRLKVISEAIKLIENISIE